MEKAEVCASEIFDDSTCIAHPELKTEYQEKFSKEIKDIEKESVQQATVTVDSTCIAGLVRFIDRQFIDTQFIDSQFIDTTVLSTPSLST